MRNRSRLVDMTRYLALFLNESQEHLAAAAALLPRVEDPNASSEAVRDLFRHLHSIKGAAATMGCTTMRRISHAAEDLLVLLRSGATVPTQHMVSLLLDTVSCLERMLDAMAVGDPPEDPHAAALTERLRVTVSACDAGSDRSIASDRREISPAAPGTEERSDPDRAMAERSPAGLLTWRIDIAHAAGPLAPADGIASLLERLRHLGSLLHSSPSMRVLTNGVERRLTVLLQTDLSEGELAARLQDLEDVASFTLSPDPEPAGSAPDAAATTPWIRVRGDLVESAIETVTELRRQHSRLVASSGDFLEGGVAERLERSTTLLRELHHRLLDLRLVPFDRLAGRLERVVREAERDLGKSVRFETEDQGLHLDRTLLEILLDPLAHTLRNAVDHGIESPSQRVAAGKDSTGRIRLSVERFGERVRVTVRDDGRGLHPDRLRRCAVRSGILTPDQATRMPDEDAINLILVPGFSTLRQAGPVSGRGVGMDVVLSQVQRAGGVVAVRSELGRGTAVELSIPMHQALVHAVLVRSGGGVFALPVDAVERVLEQPPDCSRATEESSVLTIDGCEEVPLAFLDRTPPQNTRVAPPGSAIVLVDVDGKRCGISVDEVLGKKEIVVEPLDRSLVPERIWSGAALLEDGSLVLIVDPRRLGRD
jgi:two-component system chemotaxis sensor kinase CheA